jgi:hypothetical protein
MRKIKKINFKIPYSVIQSNSVLEYLDVCLEEKRIGMDEFVSFEFIDSDVLSINYIDGHESLKMRIVDDARKNYENNEGIIWTLLDSYDDLLSIKSFLHKDYVDRLDNKQKINEFIDKNIPFAFWVEEDKQLRFTY